MLMASKAPCVAMGVGAFVKFAYNLGVFVENTSFVAIDGPHVASIKEGLVYLKMIDVTSVEKNNGYDFLNTGSPHYVEFVENLTTYPVFEKGKAIRLNDYFFPKGGTNVNFVEKINEDKIFVRTYERGVENETYSCGTGVTAAALSASFKNFKSPVNIKTLGGDLQVSFDFQKDTLFSNIFLIGPAEEVFQGLIEIEDKINYNF